MPTFKFSAVIGVSAYTTVEADTEEEALEIAERREPVIGGRTSGFSDDEHWIVEEADGTPTNIELA